LGDVSKTKYLCDFLIRRANVAGVAQSARERFGVFDCRFGQAGDTGVGCGIAQANRGT
jgi:hypothetical protein